MQQVRGNVVHCSRFGCVVRLEDGRLGLLPAGEQGIDHVKRALNAGRHPTFPFAIAEQQGRRVRLALAHVAPEPAEQKLASSLEEKIIDFWRQVSDWDRNAGRVEPQEPPHKRIPRLLPFEERAPEQYREMPKRFRKGPKSTRHNRP
ncbi:MAG TPA: hypothetical protein VEJ41_08315 [Candidatus Acidoferrales bacterium]|nr:hypothetical protein [Candidatus Acidoferrales bacterium]